MTEEQPFKRPRALFDKSRLSAADQLAFARVAQLLNKPLNELYQETPHASTVTEDKPEGLGTEERDFVDRQMWTNRPVHFHTTDTWQTSPEDSSLDYSNSQPNGLWTQLPDTDFVDQNFEDFTFGHWTEDMSQRSPRLVGNKNDTVYSEDPHLVKMRQSSGWSHEASTDEPWLSIPTKYLAQASAEAHPTDSIHVGTNPGYARDCRTSTQDNIAVPMARSTQLQKTTGFEQLSSSTDENIIEQDWVVLGPQTSNAMSQVSPKAPTTNWPTNDLSNTHHTFILEKSESKSTKWVSTEHKEKEIVPQRPQRNGPFQDQQLREETSNTRKLKACVRCRFQKIRCHIDNNNPSGTCQTCQDVSKQKIHTLSCVRYKLTECTLYRTGKAPGLEFTFRWPVMKLKDISDWFNSDIRTIKVVSDDSLQKSWMDGKVKKFKPTTPFAIADMSATVKIMREYIDKHVFQCMEFWLVGRDPIIQETYKFARQYMLVAPREEAHLLAEFFRLWFAVRRTATTEFIDGEDTLDMEPETTDRSYPLFGKVPLPPVMIQQLDMILTLGFLQPLRKKVLEDFQKIVLNNKPKSWMAIYLVTFISLHSAATVTSENYQNARKHGLKRRFAMPTFISDRHHSANVFLTHYHYRTKPCNPFNIDWRKRQTTPFSDMTTNEIDFLLKTSEMVEERKGRFRRIRENNLYEDDLYFISQIFDDEWEPVDTIIDYGDETIFGVPLKQSGSPKRNGDV